MSCNRGKGSFLVEENCFGLNMARHASIAGQVKENHVPSRGLADVMRLSYNGYNIWANLDGSFC